MLVNFVEISYYISYFIGAWYGIQGRKFVGWLLEKFFFSSIFLMIFHFIMIFIGNFVIFSPTLIVIYPHFLILIGVLLQIK